MGAETNFYEILCFLAVKSFFAVIALPGDKNLWKLQVAAGSAEQIRVSSARIHFLSAGIKCKKSGAETFSANAFCATLISNETALQKGVESERRAHTDTSIRCKFNRLESSTLSSRFSQMGLRARRQREEQNLCDTRRDIAAQANHFSRAAQCMCVVYFILFLHATLNLSSSAPSKVIFY